MMRRPTSVRCTASTASPSFGRNQRGHCRGNGQRAGGELQGKSDGEQGGQPDRAQRRYRGNGTRLGIHRHQQREPERRLQHHLQQRQDRRLHRRRRRPTVSNSPDQRRRHTTSITTSVPAQSEQPEIQNNILKRRHRLRGDGSSSNNIITANWFDSIGLRFRLRRLAAEQLTPTSPTT